ncbi:DUF2264 domain-containing protein [Sunxiuqinia indica]|uniref:DUF2264 domain-containing protein n=1 Tax=Sunxiuqinia indica TaxID=2692584 RepID=UPI00293B977B|nr:DUF2264 domain-containing protein [Sunxiuqinia indica]
MLHDGSKRQLKVSLSVETTTGAKEKPSTYLKTVGRLLAGISPWLESESGNREEKRLRSEYGEKTLQTIAAIVDSGSPDFFI